MLDWQLLDEYSTVAQEITQLSLKILQPFYEEHKISNVKIQLLSILDNHDNITLNILADKMGKASTNLSVVASKLEHDGYLNRVKSKTDKRIMYFQITNKGHDIVSKVRAYANEKFGDILKDRDDFKDLLDINRKFRDKLAKACSI